MWLRKRFVRLWSVAIMFALKWQKELSNTDCFTSLLLLVITWTNTVEIIFPEFKFLSLERCSNLNSCYLVWIRNAIASLGSEKLTYQMWHPEARFRRWLPNQLNHLQKSPGSKLDGIISDLVTDVKPLMFFVLWLANKVVFSAFASHLTMLETKTHQLFLVFRVENAFVLTSKCDRSIELQRSTDI